jgi:small subunit ribosomal protein S1
MRNLEKFIGEEFEFKVIKFNKKRGNIVLSRRVLLEKERAELKSRPSRSSRRPDAEGHRQEHHRVRRLRRPRWHRRPAPHHRHELGPRQPPVRDVQVGDEIEVKVLKFNPETERVSLGLKQISEDPWGHAETKYPVGDRVKGKVVSLTDYGAFVELEEGIEGLIHISEMSWTKRVKHPSKMVAIGDTVEAIVLDIDSKNKRISLGMKQIEPNPWTLLHERYPVGTRILGKIRNITDFGIFVGIEEGIDGLVHISDMSWTQRSSTRPSCTRRVTRSRPWSSTSTSRTSASASASSSSRPTPGRGHPPEVHHRSRGERQDHQDPRLRRLHGAGAGGRGSDPRR